MTCNDRMLHVESKVQPCLAKINKIGDRVQDEKMANYQCVKKLTVYAKPGL